MLFITFDGEETAFVLLFPLFSYFSLAGITPSGLVLSSASEVSVRVLSSGIWSSALLIELRAKRI